MDDEAAEKGKSEETKVHKLREEKPAGGAGPDLIFAEDAADQRFFTRIDVSLQRVVFKSEIT